MIQNLFNYIFLLLVFLSLFYSFKKIKAGKVYIKIFNFMFILLALLVAFRYGTGIDTANYMVAYEYIPQIDEMSIGTLALFRFQPLYTIINSVCKFIWPDFLLVQIAQVLAFYPALYVLLKYFDLRNFYALLFLYCFTYFGTGMSAMRESFAVGMGFWSIYFFFNKKYILNILFCFLSFGFHSGGILFFIVPMLRFLPFFKTLSLKRLLVFSFVMLLFSLIFTYLQKNMTVGDGNFQRYQIEDSHFSILNILKNLFLIVLLYLSCFKKKYSDYAEIIYLAVMYVLIDLLSSAYLGILSRFSSHLCIFMLVGVKIMFKEQRQQLVVFSLAVFLTFYQPFMRFYSLMTNKDYGRCLWYCSYFADVQDKSMFYKIIIQSGASDYLL